MQIVKIVLLSLMVALLLGLAVDGVQRSRQLQTIHAQLGQGVRLAPGGVPVTNPTPMGNTAGVAPSVDAGSIADGILALPLSLRRDGVPRPWTDFLLPPPQPEARELVGGTFREYEDVPKGLNPLTESIFYAAKARSLMHDSLCSLAPGDSASWQAELAERVAISDDWRTFIIRIRPGITWQVPALAEQPAYAWLRQPVPLTAHDFVFFINMVKHPEVKAGQLKPYFESCTASALDERTFVVHWAQREYSNISSTLALEPLPRHIYARDREGSATPELRLGTSFNEHWFDAERQFIGVGPYRLVEFVPGQRLVMARNPGYAGRGLCFARIEWDGAVKEPVAELRGFKNGEVHIGGLSPEQYKAEILDRGEPRFPALNPTDPSAGRAGPLAWERRRSHRYSGIAWNCTRPQLADVRVRRALAHAFPKERVLKDIMLGLGQPQVGPVHPDNPGYAADLVDKPFSTASAAALLDEAGWRDSDGDGWRDRSLNGRPTSLAVEIVTYIHNPTMMAILGIYRETLRPLGVELRITGVEAEAWEKRSDERDFDGFVIAWSMNDFDNDFKQVWHSSSISTGGSNYACWSNPEADRLIDAIRLSFEPAERAALSRDFQRLVVAEQPYLFLFSVEGISTWQAQDRPERELQALLGVVDGFSAVHSLYSRSSRRGRESWHLVRP
jgi:peptide/nickel transport system substrate-binding protein